MARSAFGLHLGLLLHGVAGQGTSGRGVAGDNISLTAMAGAALLGGPPKRALDYSGVDLPAINVAGVGPSHVVAIGDWGGLDGTLWEGEETPNGRPRLIVDKWGAVPGPSVFPRSRWNKQHTVELCSHDELVECFENKGQPPCAEGCGYDDVADSHAQLLVASALKAHAAKTKPDYILNVGDNFYWGGIERECGTPMGEISPEARHQFDQVFEGVYSGPGLDGVPWLSVLGNHDWGGRQFNAGWDQQIAYTWASKRWVMPAPYFSQRVNYKDQGFSVDYLFLDSNAMDAKEPDEDADTNICSAEFNQNQGLDKRDASCAAADGPKDVSSCKKWFWDFWDENKRWAVERLSKSTADWQIAVTHFPCGHEASWYSMLHQTLGLDLLVTGHRHDQELWAPGDPRTGILGGMACLVTGGGGGITSESTPLRDDGTWYGEGQYGFYDMVISKSEVTLTSINYDGKVLREATVKPN